MQAFNQAVKETSAFYLIEESALSWLKDKKAACWAWCYIKNQNKPFLWPPNTHFQANASVYKPTFVSPEHMPADIPPFYSDTGIPEPELSPKGLLEAATAFLTTGLLNVTSSTAKRIPSGVCGKPEQAGGNEKDSLISSMVATVTPLSGAGRM
jgi:hypothetical protein